MAADGGTTISSATAPAVPSASSEAIKKILRLTTAPPIPRWTAVSVARNQKVGFPAAQTTVSWSLEGESRTIVKFVLLWQVCHALDGVDVSGGCRRAKSQKRSAPVGVQPRHSTDASGGVKS